ncbi:STY4851/ECs_5259 family protein [Sphingomonas limnosediminicola]|uniref:STY4851/ECs_5259 family protein n=1 Tax=Sphingomonas limnosediminicola TaxID=940133 RepID=A0ABP7L5E6_9SPHN
MGSARDGEPPGAEKELLELRLREAGDDVGKLAALSTALAERSELWVRAYRIRAIARMQAARSRKEHGGSPKMALAVSKYGISSPDGRWLYQYKVSDESFRQLAKDVRALAGKQPLQDSSVAAGLFVLWASEWFRRCHEGGVLRWQELEHAIGLSRPQQAWRDTAKRGLDAWGRPVISGASARYFLGTLAREGGFPAAAIKQEHRGWACEVLQSLVAALVLERAPDEEVALELARSLAQKLPLAFSDEDFLVLCADLALAITRLRMDAQEPASAAGIPVSAWLDVHRPDWRDGLPMRTDAPAAAALLDQLMLVKARPMARGELAASRILRLTAKGWEEALRLHLDGALGASAARALASSEGRLQLYAARELARYVPWQLASISSQADSWEATGYQEAAGTYQVPFSVPIGVVARSERRAEGSFELTGGAAIRSPFLVFAITSRDQEGPLELLVRGSGSGCYREEELALRTPDDWQVVATAGDEDVRCLGEGGAGYRLWLVRGGAAVLTPDGDRYRVVGRQAFERKDRIELIGNALPGVEPCDPELVIYRGPPLVSLCRGGQRVANAGQLYVRRAGKWQPAPAPLPEGNHEIGWLDCGILRDRLRLAVVPSTATLKTGRTGKQARFELTGWSGCRLAPLEGAPVLHLAADTLWVGRETGEVVRRFTAEITWPEPNERAALVTVRYPAGAGISDDTGRVLRPREMVTPRDLPRLAAFADGAMVMFARLRDDRGLRVPETDLSWSFEDEMPLTMIAADVGSVLASAQIGSRVELGLHDGIEDYWYVAQFDKELLLDGNGLVSSRGVVEAGTVLCGRAIERPTEEREIASYSLVDEQNHRPIRLPPDLTGRWLVYLRAEDQVISRPLVYCGQAQSAAARNSFEHAMALPQIVGEEALREALEKASADGPDAASLVHYLNELVASLRGLPPVSVPVLQYVAEYPGALARMVLFGSEKQREAVLRLEGALPFAWYLIPADTWKRAEGAMFEDARSKLEKEGVPGSDVTRYALQMAMGAKLDLLTRQPILNAVLGGAAERHSIRDVVQRFLNRNIDRISRAEGSVFREKAGLDLPTYFLELPPRSLEVLDAPCAAALAACGRWLPSIRHLRRIKSVARTFPAFFEEAFTATFLHEVETGNPHRELSSHGC